MGDLSRYKNYLSEDFALDTHFQEWVLKPDDAIEQFWSDFLRENPSKRKEVEKGIELVKLSGLTIDQEANEAFLEGWSNIEANASKSVKVNSRKIAFASLAAAMLLIAIASVYLIINTRPDPRTYQTKYNETKELTLDDGSVVTLNSNSTLLVGFDKNDNHREVNLNGEAFFKVAHTPDQKSFQVTLSGGVSVHVLGTEFNVIARKRNISVYLESGSVRLHTPNGDDMLKPGQQGTMNLESQKFIVLDPSGDEAKSMLAWKSSLYIMNDVPLSQVAQYIEDNFGLQVVIQNPSLAEKRITAKVPAHDLNVLLKVLSEGLSIRAEKRNERVFMNAL